jgi:hypothetical protein
MNKKGMEKETVVALILGIILLLFFILYYSGILNSMVDLTKQFIESVFGL